MSIDISGVIAALKVVVTELPGAVSTGLELVDLGTKFYEAANGHVPTIAEVAELRKAVDEDVATALEPLPPAQPGDPDYVAPVVDPLDQPFVKSAPIAPGKTGK
jgi:hypothetical protein